MSLTGLTAEKFVGRVRETFVLSTANATLDLVLSEVEDLGPGPHRRAFSLFFLGPARPILPQAIYRLDNPATGPLEMFLVPLGLEKGLFRYQAVFN